MADKTTPSALKASLITLGCPMNQVDSERIIAGLAAKGFSIVPEEQADVIVVNTCGFIESAREESIETILSVAGLKQRGNLKAIVIAGCLAERYKRELQEELSEADAVVGLADSGKIPDMCYDLLNREQSGETVASRVLMGHPHMSYLKITEGCDNRCAYCAIPLIRGSFRSVPEENILAEARELAELGIRELILIGQDTTMYGSDTKGFDLTGLLEKLNDIEGITWIRLMYSHPAHLSGEMIEAVNGIMKVLPYIDLPLQHISDTILQRMGRHVTQEKIKQLIGNIREKIEGAVIRTALITGFPGETEKDFLELLDFVADTRFERLGAFVYSPEEGTRAASFGDSVPEEIAEERYKRLMELQNGISADFHASLIGREFDMIVDGVNSENGGAFGRTYMDAPEIDGNVSVTRGVEETTAFCRILITGAEIYDLTGEVITK